MRSGAGGGAIARGREGAIYSSTRPARAPDGGALGLIGLTERVGSVCIVLLLFLLRVGRASRACRVCAVSCVPRPPSWSSARLGLSLVCVSVSLHMRASAHTCLTAFVSLLSVKYTSKF